MVSLRQSGLLVLSGVLLVLPLRAQPAGAPQPANQTQAAPAAKHKKTANPKRSPAVAETPAPEPPQVPPAPSWPANAQAEPAKVGWNGRELKVTATNSSLQQILHDISAQTGVKVEGMGGDQRVFGSYGPGEPRGVLTELLDGSGYNVMIIGDKASGTPREVVLTAKSNAGAENPNAAGAQVQQQGTPDEDTTEEQEQPEDQQPPERPFGMPPQPGPPGRTPQEIFQELQQRQQQQQQQQMQTDPQPQ